MTEIDMYTVTGKPRTDFTKAELESLPPERVKLFRAFAAAAIENDAAEAALRDASANVVQRAKALSASQAVLQQFRPKISEYAAVRAYLASIGR